MVPLALINLEKFIEPNWDLTMAKVQVLFGIIEPYSRVLVGGRSVNT